jgi:hypothetical protein
MTHDSHESGYAKPVAPAWQPVMWFGAEVAPVGALILIVCLVAALVPSLIVKGVAFGIGGVFLGLLRYLGDLDDHYFASTMGFTDRGEYVASATVGEYERDLNPKMFGIF